MIYCFLGQDTNAKREKIEEVKAKLFKSQDYFNFDYESLHAHKLDPDVLKQALIALPVIASQRLVIIRETEKLNAQGKRVLLEFISKTSEYLVLILDFEVVESKDELLASLRTKTKIFEFGVVQRANVFDMTRAIGMRNSTEALRLLDELVTAGDYPPQMVGAILWFWSNKVKEKISKKNFQDGLVLLQEADLNIKRSRLKPQYALEVLVTRLC